MIKGIIGSATPDQLETIFHCLKNNTSLRTLSTYTLSTVNISTLSASLTVNNTLQESCALDDPTI